MLDILAAKQLIEQAHMMVAWVPTWRQFADGWTEDMVDELFSEFKSQGMVCLRETVEDRQWEARRADLRRGQRERRKARMIKNMTPTSSFLDVEISGGKAS